MLLKFLSKNRWVSDVRCPDHEKPSRNTVEVEAGTLNKPIFLMDLCLEVVALPPLKKMETPTKIMVKLVNQPIKKWWFDFHGLVKQPLFI